METLEIKPIAGNFELESSLMWQLELLKTEKLAKNGIKNILNTIMVLTKVLII